MAKYLIETDQGKFEVETEEPAQDHPDYLAPGAEKSFAEQAVSAISPTETPKDRSFLSSLAEGTREMFAPSMEGLKRLINPNAGQFGPSRALQQVGEQLGGAVRSAAQNTAEQVATSKFGQRNPNTAAAIGAGYSTLADVASDSLTPSAFQQQLGGEGIGIAAKLFAPAIKAAAVDPARRALGFQKSQLVSQKSPFETARKIAQANRSAKAMLEAGAISPTGSVDDTIQNATKILSEGSRKMSNVMDKLNSSGYAVPIKDVQDDLLRTLKPKNFDEESVLKTIINKDVPFKKVEGAAEKIVGGLNPDLSVREVVNKAPDTISITQLDDLRAVLGKKGFGDATVGTAKVEMYRKAYKAVDNILKNKIGAGSPELLSEYVAGKAAQENAINALKALGNKQAADLGNNVFSLPTKVLAAGQLATGNVPAALATLGVGEVLKRRGLAPIARGTYGVGKALETGTKPGFLASLQASVRRSSAPAQKKEEPKSGKGERILRDMLKKAIEPGVTKSQASMESIPKSQRFSKDVQAYRVGLEAFLRGDTKAAKDNWIASLRINPKNLEARRGLERLAQKEGKDIDTYRRQAI